MDAPLSQRQAGIEVVALTPLSCTWRRRETPVVLLFPYQLERKDGRSVEGEGWKEYALMISAAVPSCVVKRDPLATFISFISAGGGR